MGTLETAMQAFIASQGATPKGDSKATDTYEVKLRALVDLEKALADAREKGDTQALDQWKVKYQEEGDNARKEADLLQDSYKTLMTQKVDLDESQRRSIASALRMAAAAEETGTKWNSGAESMVQGWFRKGGASPEEGGGTWADPSNAAVKQSVVGDYASPALNADDPRVPHATSRLLDMGFSAAELKSQAPDKWAAYEASKSKGDSQAAGQARAYAARVESGGRLTQKELDDLGQKMLDASKIAAPTTPELDLSKREKTAAEKSLEDAKASLGIGGTPPEEELPGFGGLTRTQVKEIVSNPNFKAWAKDRGFKDLGETSQTGVFYLGDDTRRAFREAQADLAGKRGQKVVGELTGQVIDTKVAKPVLVIEGSVATGAGEPYEGKVPYAWVRTGEGDEIVHLDMETGTMSPARDKAGYWTSSLLRDTFAEDSAGKDFHQIGVKGKSALTYSGLKMQAQQGGLDKSTLAEKPEELLEVRPQTVEFRGARLRGHPDEDPELVARLLNDDGSTITLSRPSKESPWKVVEGAFPPPDITPTPGKVVPRTRIRDAWEVLTGKKEVEQRVEDGSTRSIPRVLPADEPPPRLEEVPIPERKDKIIPFRDVLDSLFQKRAEKVKPPEPEAPVRVKPAPQSVEPRKPSAGIPIAEPDTRPVTKEEPIVEALTTKPPVQVPVSPQVDMRPVPVEPVKEKVDALRLLRTRYRDARLGESPAEAVKRDQAQVGKDIEEALSEPDSLTPEEQERMKKATETEPLPEDIQKLLESRKVSPSSTLAKLAALRRERMGAPV